VRSQAAALALKNVIYEIWRVRAFAPAEGEQTPIITVGAPVCSGVAESGTEIFDLVVKTKIFIQ
jgi:hypothetical protein